MLQRKSSGRNVWGDLENESTSNQFHMALLCETYGPYLPMWLKKNGA